MSKFIVKQMKLDVADKDGQKIGEITATLRLDKIDEFIKGLEDRILVHEMTGNGLSSVAQNYKIFINYIGLFQEQIKELERQSKKDNDKIKRLEDKIKRWAKK